MEKFWLNEAFWLTIIVVLSVILIVWRTQHERRTLRFAGLSFILYFFGLPLVLLLPPGTSTGMKVVHTLGLILSGVALINLGSLLVFEVLLPVIRLSLPRIVRDTIIIGAYGIAIMSLLTSLGVNITSVIATSAIVTAVIGLSLQDTLGNIMAGLSLQLEQVIEVGDWIKVDQHVGCVREIRWRQTSIETRNWDTVVIPNSQLMKSQVLIYGHRQNAPLQTRQWVYFNVDFRYSPTEVIECVNLALQNNPIENVAHDPLPHTLVIDFKESYCLYAVRYWLTDLALDSPTDSTVRTRIYFALKRAGIPLSIPAYSAFITEETRKRKERKEGKEMEHRLEVLQRIELFHTLTREELVELTHHMRYAPFSKGEIVTRQGAEGHWLYIISTGHATVQVASAPRDGSPSIQKEVTQLGPNDIFGEMSLMTGEPRAATIIALDEVECYRLDKEAFQGIIAARPQLAEDFSHILAKRRIQLDAVREGLSHETQRIRIGATQNHMLELIRDFFGL